MSDLSNELKKLNNIAISEIKNGNITRGISLLEQINKITSYRNPASLINSALAYFESSDLIRAQARCTAALKLHPNSATGYHLLGKIYFQSKLYLDAVTAYQTAHDLSDKKDEICNDIANAYRSNGDLKEAIDYYVSALKLNKLNKNALRNIISILTQLNRFESGSLNEAIQLSLSSGTSTDDALIKTYVLIGLYIEGKKDQCRALIKILDNLLNDKKFEDVYLKGDRKFILAYLAFIKNLGFDESNLLSNFPCIYHIGESHCLSYANNKISINSSQYIIKPKIVFGAKAYHFGVAEGNQFKAIFEAHIVSIPLSALIFCSFGEIDTRADEGLQMAHQKMKIDLNILISETAKNYVSYLAKIFSNRNSKNIFVFAVPAPLITEKKLSDNTRIKIIRDFNIQLHKYVEEFGMIFVDIYSISVNSDGISNLKFHSDKYHLNARAIPAIEELIRLQLR